MSLRKIVCTGITVDFFTLFQVQSDFDAEKMCKINYSRK